MHKEPNAIIVKPISVYSDLSWEKHVQKPWKDLTNYDGTANKLIYEISETKELE